MNKTELIAAVAEKTGMTKKDAERVINATVESITSSLVKGEKVQIVGFGSFEVKARPERVARNPQAPDQEITIPASKAPVFKAGKSLKEAAHVLIGKCKWLHRTDVLISKIYTSFFVSMLVKLHSVKHKVLPFSHS